MKTYFVYPSVGSLVRLFFLVSGVCGLMALTSYPVEEWGGVAVVWTLAFSVILLGLASLNSWALAGVERRLSRSASRMMRAAHRTYPRRTESLGRAYGMGIVSVAATGGGLVVAWLSLPALGFTPFPSALGWGMALLLGAVAAEVVVLMAAGLLVRMVESISDERLEEMGARSADARVRSRTVGSRVAVVLAMLMGVAMKVMSSSPMPERFLREQ